MSEEYTVKKIWQLNRMSDTGGLEKYYRVMIKTKEGIILDIDIDEKDFTEAKTKAILIKAAQNADKIMTL